MSSEIRLARADDAKAISVVSASLGYRAREEAEAMRDLDELLLSPRERVWVVECNRRIAGWLHAFISIRVASPRFVEIGGLAVGPEYRGRGIGGQLVRQAVEWASSERLGIRVRCNAERPDTHKFYRALGFSALKSQFVFEQQVQQPVSDSPDQAC